MSESITSPKIQYAEQMAPELMQKKMREAQLFAMIQAEFRPPEGGLDLPAELVDHIDARAVSTGHPC